MDNELVTLDSIIAWFKDSIENKHPVPPSTYLDAAAKLLVLLEDLDEEVIEAEMSCNAILAKEVELGKSAAAAKIVMRADAVYKKLLQLQAKKERVMGFVQVSKKRTETRI